MWSLFLVFNNILFFLIITTIHICYQHNVSHNIADFSVSMGYKIFHPLIYLNDPLFNTASQPAKCWTRHQKDHLQTAKKNECKPTLQHAINPSIQNNLVRFRNVYFSEIMWIILETLPDPLTPGDSPHHLSHHLARSKDTIKMVANEINFILVVAGLLKSKHKLLKQLQQLYNKFMRNLSTLYAFPPSPTPKRHTIQNNKPT